MTTLQFSPTEYKGTYCDLHGSESVTVANDGEVLRLKIRGVAFSGPDFDRLSPSDGTSLEGIAKFTVSGSNTLCSFELMLDIPIPVVVNQAETQGILHMNLQVGHPTPNGGVQCISLQLVLAVDDHTTKSSGQSGGYFEEELLDIERQLPEDVYIKGCVNCLYSDYSIVGNGMFGDMQCYRNMKADYLAAHSKAEWFELSKRCDTRVQEIYICPDFTLRIPGTGYRG